MICLFYIPKHENFIDMSLTIDVPTKSEKDTCVYMKKKEWI